MHGDAHLSNVLRTPDGPIWNDFEDACSAPLEWDYACLVASARLTGTRDEAGEATLRAAAPDIDERALAPFVEARQLQSVAWSTLIAAERPSARERATARLAAWRAKRG